MSNLYSFLLGGVVDAAPPPPATPANAFIADDEVPFDVPLVHYSATVADRRPSPRKRGSAIGRVADPFRRREVHFESGLERRHLVTLIVNPNVVDIREQQTRSYFVQGRRHKYTTDFLVTFRSGVRVAFEVKYEADVLRQGTEDLLREVAEHVGDDLADEYRLLTETHVNDIAVANAKAIISCGCDFDVRGQDVVRTLLLASPATLTLREIGLQSGLSRRGQRAAIALIQQGALTFDPDTLLSPDVKLRNLCTQ